MEAKWPKILPDLTEEQKKISDDYMQYWHGVYPNHLVYGILDHFSHRYPVKHSPGNFLSTLEVGAGLGEHLKYEHLSKEQQENYVAVDIREGMVKQLSKRFPKVKACVADCQKPLGFPENRFDRIIAIHVLEHLPNLPAAILEFHRLCNKQHGVFLVVIPCEGGFVHSFARKVSSKRIFEKRYNQPYQWWIEREHVNRPNEIIAELEKHFEVIHRAFFPFWAPVIFCNLCIGLTLRPKNSHSL